MIVASRPMTASFLALSILCAAAPASTQEATPPAGSDSGASPSAAEAALPAPATTGFDELVSQANEAYKDGRYEQSAALFRQAYGLRPKPNILYNIGRIYERAKNIPEALAAYDQFLALSNADLNLRKEALERRKLLRELADLREQEAQKEQDKSVTSLRPNETIPSAEDDGAGAGPWILVGIGGAALVTSGVFALLTAGHQDTYESDSETLEAKQAARDDGETTALIADITLGVGRGVGAHRADLVRRIRRR